MTRMAIGALVDRYLAHHARFHPVDATFIGLPDGHDRLPPAGPDTPADERQSLRALRRDLAQDAGVPPYVIFHDATLREMAEIRPASLAALGEIGGVGARKLEAYGDAFLSVIRQH